MMLPHDPTLQQTIGEGLLGSPVQVPNLYILRMVHIGSELAKEAVALIKRMCPKMVVLEVTPSHLERMRLQLQLQRQNKPTDTAPIGHFFSGCPWCLAGRQIEWFDVCNSHNQEWSFDKNNNCR
jgi:hypothetical protein